MSRNSDRHVRGGLWAVLLGMASLGLVPTSASADPPAAGPPPVSKLAGHRATDLDAPTAVGPAQRVEPSATLPGSAQPGVLLWEDRVDAGGFGQYFATAAGRGRIYAAGFRSGPTRRDALVRAYDGRTGGVLWENALARAGDDFASGVATDGDAVFVSGTAQVPGHGYDWTLRAYDAATGALRWETIFDLEGRSDFSRGTALAVRGGLVFLGGYGTTAAGDTDWVVRAHEASSGVLAWQDRRDVSGRDDGVRSLTATAVGLFAGGWGDTADSGNAVVRAYDGRSGTMRWQQSTPGLEGVTFTKKVVAEGNGVYMGAQIGDASALSGIVRGFDARTGAALWQSPPVLVEDIAVAAGKVIVAGQGGPNCDLFLGPQSDCEALVRTLDAGSGAPIWERLLRLSGADDVAARIVAGRGTVYISGDLNAIHVLPGCCVIGRWFVQAFGLESGSTLWRHVGADGESGVYNMALDQSRLFVPGRAVEFAANDWTPIVRAYDARGRTGSVDAVPPIVPGQLNLTGTSGQASFDALFSGTLTSTVRGLMPGDVQTGNVVDDPADDIRTAFQTGVGLTEHLVSVPAATAFLQIRLFDADTDGIDDLDLYVFDADFNFVGSSGTPTSDEQVRLADPAPGIYHVFVHGFETDGPDANYLLFSWALFGDEGNLVVTGPPAGGPSGAVTLTWSGLAPGGRYLGIVQFSDGTFVVDSAVYIRT